MTAPAMHLAIGATTACDMATRDVSPQVTLRPEQVTCDGCRSRLEPAELTLTGRPIPELVLTDDDGDSLDVRPRYGNDGATLYVTAATVNDDLAVAVEISRHDARQLIRYVAAWLGEPEGVAELQCVCNVGVQQCPAHPGRLKTQDERIAFRKAWDAAVDGYVRCGRCSALFDPVTGHHCAATDDEHVRGWLVAEATAVTHVEGQAL
jgi:hypothetical protein